MQGEKHSLEPFPVLSCWPAIRPARGTGKRVWCCTRRGTYNRLVVCIITEDLDACSPNFLAVHTVSSGRTVVGSDDLHEAGTVGGGNYYQPTISPWQRPVHDLVTWPLLLPAEKPLPNVDVPMAQYLHVRSCSGSLQSIQPRERHSKEMLFGINFIYSTSVRTLARIRSCFPEQCKPRTRFVSVAIAADAARASPLPAML